MGVVLADAGAGGERLDRRGRNVGRAGLITHMGTPAVHQGVQAVERRAARRRRGERLDRRVGLRSGRAAQIEQKRQALDGISGWQRYSGGSGSLHGGYRRFLRRRCGVRRRASLHLFCSGRGCV